MMSNNYTDFTELYNDIKMMEQHILIILYWISGTVLFILTFFSLCLYLNFYNNKKNEEVNQNLLEWKQDIDTGINSIGVIPTE